MKLKREVIVYTQTKFSLELFSKLSFLEFVGMADISSLDLSQVKRELIQANWDCSIRGLIHGATR